MEKDNEVSGLGNSNTAEFWQYDSRLGRRWNVDPVVKEWESPYLTYSGNPIFFIDPSGASASPIIDVGTGELLGADDQGMQGEAIFMRSEQFTKGMSHDKAEEVGVKHTDYKENASPGILQRAEEVIKNIPRFELKPGEIPFSLVETTFVSAGEVVVGSVGKLEISSLPAASSSLQGKLTTGTSFTQGFSVGLPIEVMYATRGTIILDMPISGNNIEEIFSQVNFVTVQTVGALPLSIMLIDL